MSIVPLRSGGPLETEMNGSGGLGGSGIGGMMKRALDLGKKAAGDGGGGGQEKASLADHIASSDFGGGTSGSASEAGAGAGWGDDLWSAAAEGGWGGLGGSGGWLEEDGAFGDMVCY
jgi:hypothetical protein